MVGKVSRKFSVKEAGGLQCILNKQRVTRVVRMKSQDGQNYFRWVSKAERPRVIGLIEVFRVVFRGPEEDFTNFKGLHGGSV